MSTRVEDVDATLFYPVPGVRERVGHCHHRRGAVDHGRVDDLALATSLRGKYRRHHAKDQEQGSATEIAYEIECRHGSLAHSPDGPERPSNRHVVDVVTSSLRQWSFLAVTGHARVDETLVPLPHVFGTQSQSFGHARSKAFNENVCSFAQFQHEVTSRLVFQIQRHGRSRSVQNVPSDAVVSVRVASLETKNLRPKVREQHTGVGTRADAGEF